MSSDKEQQVEYHNSWWGRHFGYLSAEAKGWFWLVLLLLICGGFYLGFWYSCQQPNPITVPYVTAQNYVENHEEAPKTPDYFGEDGTITVLLMGCDMREGEKAGRSDTIMLAFVSAEKKAVNLLSIPRDTRVELAEGKDTTKINHAFAYGGVPLTRKTIENFLDVEIDRYVTVDFQGFADVIDALGGVDYDVEQRMYYPAEHIDLQPGPQHLDGQAALSYVRWRGTATADIGRIERQQKFLSTVLEQVMSTGTILRLPNLIITINTYIQTDFTLPELTSLINVFKDVSNVTFNSSMVPGDGTMINGISYWQYYPNQTAELLEQMKTFTYNLPVEEPPASADGNGTDNDAAGAAGNNSGNTGGN